MPSQSRVPGYKAALGTLAVLAGGAGALGACGLGNPNQLPTPSPTPSSTQTSTASHAVPAPTSLPRPTDESANHWSISTSGIGGIGPAEIVVDTTGSGHTMIVSVYGKGVAPDELNVIGAIGTMTPGQPLKTEKLTITQGAQPQLSPPKMSGATWVFRSPLYKTPSGYCQVDAQFPQRSVNQTSSWGTSFNIDNSGHVTTASRPYTTAANSVASGSVAASSMNTDYMNTNRISAPTPELSLSLGLKN